MEPKVITSFALEELLDEFKRRNAAITAERDQAWAEVKRLQERMLVYVEAVRRLKGIPEP